MNDSNGMKEILEVIAQVLIRCFMMGFLVLLFWFGALLLAGDLVYSVHSKIVPLSQEQFDLIHYSGMLMVKAMTFMLFFFPYLAIRLVLKKQSP